MTKIFISYRRQSFIDGDWREHDFDIAFVSRLVERLSKDYKADDVFRDVDKILGGREFEEVIGKALDTCTVQLVVIAPNWVDALDADGHRRLDDPGDWVRREIEHGLAREDLLVIPVIAGSAPKPTPEDLPESLRPLLRRNWVEVRERSFAGDYKQLTRSIGGRPGLARRTKVAGAALVGLVALGTLGAMALRDGSGDGDRAAGDRPPAVAAAPTTTTTTTPPMTGSFNIAVADFVAADAASTGGAQALARSFSDTLERSLTNETGDRQVEVRGPATIGTLPGDDAASRSRAARDLAGQINAAVVIGGEIEFRGNQTVLRPELTLNPDAVAADPALGGPWDLGPLKVRGSLSSAEAAGPELVEALELATDGLAQFVRGIDRYQDIDGVKANILPNAPIEPGSAQRNRDQARTAFLAALATNGLPPSGQSAAHLFLGSLALLRSDLAAARTEFATAARLDPKSARAQLGVAEVELLTGGSRACAAGTVDATALARADAAFREAARLADRLADQAEVVKLKAEVGHARVLRCQSQAGLADEFGTAQKLLEDVIAATGDAPELRELTALAHAELALASAPTVGDAPDADALSTSLAETQLAVDTTGRAENKAAFLVQKAFYLNQLGRSDEAASTLAEAAALNPGLATTTVADLRPQSTGLVTPQGGIGGNTTTASLPLTGRDLGQELALALALILMGLVLNRWSARVAVKA